VTRIHQLRGISCTFPENWQLSEDGADERLASFTLQSPHTAFMSVYVCRDSGQSRPLIDEMAALLSKEYEGVERVEFEPEELEWGAFDTEDATEDLQGVELNFYYLDLLVTTRLIAYTAGTQTVLVQCQAEDREFQALESVFQAMLISMMMKTRNEKTSPDPS
jgi:hypothetical protein